MIYWFWLLAEFYINLSDIKRPSSLKWIRSHPTPRCYHWLSVWNHKWAYFYFRQSWSPWCRLCFSMPWPMSNRVLSHAGQQQVSCLISVYSGLISSTRLLWSIRLNRTRKRTLKNGENLQIWRVFQYGKYQNSILIERITEFQFQLMPQKKKSKRQKWKTLWTVRTSSTTYPVHSFTHTYSPTDTLLKVFSPF